MWRILGVEIWGGYLNFGVEVEKRGFFWWCVGEGALPQPRVFQGFFAENGAG